MSAHTHSPTHFTKSSGYLQVVSWLRAKGWQPFAYQEATWEAIQNRQSGLVNAPTGYGKTFSVFLGALIQFINAQEHSGKKTAQRGLQLLWITPLRALAKDIGRAMEEVLEEMKIPWTVGIRNGDTSAQERTRQKKHLPEILIITPESLHLLLASKNYTEIFQYLAVIAVDEWHELLGSKRGVQVELALSRILQLIKKQSLPLPSLWGISATIGNLQEAKEVLLSAAGTEGILIQPQFRKTIQIDSVYPDEIEKYPWAGHLGLKLIRKILPILER
ncbi:MAG: DEAD/DEAH box helicase, partial [Chitinophagaceae bacterium]